MSNFSKKKKNVLFPPQESRVLSDEITEKQKKRLGMHLFSFTKICKTVTVQFFILSFLEFLCDWWV